MKNRYTIFGCLIALVLGMSSCSDELDAIRNNTRPSDVICFTASLSGSQGSSVSRGASGHLAIEQEEWLVATEKEQGVSRGAPVTLLEDSAGVIGYVYDEWVSEGDDATKPYFHNKKFNFDGDELTAESGDIRWATISKPQSGNGNVLFHVYAPYNISEGTLSPSTTGGSPTIQYTVNNENVTEQNDLIVASWQGAKGTDYGTDIEARSIPLSFEHALTGVKFKVGFKCTVTKLEVVGIGSQGTYTFGEGWKNVTSEKSYSFSFGNNGEGKDFTANVSLTDGTNTLMMIPQTLSKNAQVVLTYIEGGQTKTITSSLKDKVWQAGKMITYTIHKNAAPTTIYFDLAAGDITINNTTYTGYRYKSNGSGGFDVESVSAEHNDDYIYYVYQSTEAFTEGSYTIADNRGSVGYINGTFTRPPYPGVEGPNGEPWADYITNNKCVEDVIEMWDDGKFVKGSDAENEQHTDIAKVRDAGRTHTNHKISISGSGKYNLTIDNIYSAFQQPSTGRTTGGIAYTPNGTGTLTINSIGDNRVGCVHKDNSSTSKVFFEGTGSLTIADTDFLTNKAPADGTGDVGDFEAGYYSNHWNAAIGNNDSQNNCYGIVINSGVIFAGTTKAENCSAIGGGGNGIGDVTISGGIVTAVATTTGSAIGGGIGFHSQGGQGIVTITGGNVYAYNFANRWNIPSSAIGGGGTMESTVNAGTTISISGGNIYAESDLGTAIGGGSSYTKQGGEATINISGGKIVAKSNTNSAGIGGGCSITQGSASSELNGGNATITISGNPIIRTGSIGGGTTGAGKGKIGSANITISGGDIQAQFVMTEADPSNPPSFTMSDGTIRNSYVDDEEYRHTKKLGGAVYLEDGTFTMTGGTIKNCSAEQGGAVYIESKSGSSTFEMEGGEIHSCFATGNDKTDVLGHGGALCLMGGQVNMTGGKIWNNYSENGDGGAVYISNGNFSMNHSSKDITTEGYPTITGNSAQKGNGGGVFVSSEEGNSVQVDLLRGIITNNTANNYGGGVCVDMGDTQNEATVTVGAEGQGVTEQDANPEITGNMAMMAGGGLYVRGEKAGITIHSGMIDGNDVSAYVKNENVANHLGEVNLIDGLVTHVVVTFDGNGGTLDGAATDTQKIVKDTNSKLKANSFVLGGHNFNGWNTRKDGKGTSYSDRGFIVASEPVTLYAQWKSQTSN